MKKDLIKIITIFLIVVGIVFWGLNYIFLNQNGPKSKAAGETINLSFNPGTVSTTATNPDFTVNVVAKPSKDAYFRGYETRVNFDKTKLALKSISYKLGAVSSGLGDTNNNLTAINSTGVIKIIGESQSDTGSLLTSANANNEDDLLVLIFTVLDNSGPTSVTIGDSSFYSINTDMTLFNGWTFAKDSLSVNNDGAPLPTATTAPDEPTDTPGPTVTPGGPTLTPRPTTDPDEPTVAPAVTLSLKLKFQGILSQPKANLGNFKVKVMLAGGNLPQPIEADRVDTFGADEKGIWSGTADFTDVLPAAGYRVYIKGPYHLQKKICVAAPTESYPASYHCGQGNITLHSGKNILDFSGIYLLAGDLPLQDGSVTAYDTSFIYNNLGKTDNDKCDVNRDGICDTQDFSLVIAALSIKNDEE